MKNSIKIIVPDIGDFQEVTIIETLIAVGDEVAVETSLLTLESDKATMDVPSPVAGIISAVYVKAGDKVSAGTHIADATATEESPQLEESPQPPTAETPAPEAAVNISNAPDSGAAQEVRVLDIGDFKDILIIEILVKVDDIVAADDSLLTLESDKATMDIPAPFAGKVTDVVVAAGDKVNQGDLIIHLAPLNKKDAPSTAKSADTSPVASVASTPPAKSVSDTSASLLKTSPKETSGGLKPHAGPSVRRFARELGVDLSAVKGSGKRGRIITTDVQKWVKEQMSQPKGGALPSVPPVDFSQFGEVEFHPLSRIRKLSAGYLHRNWLVAPHVTQCGEADITDMEDFRKSLSDKAKKEGYRITPLAFFVRAAVIALRQFPEFNASLHESGEQVIHKKYFNIGIAVDTPHGLVVPVLRDVQNKGLNDIARELSEISAIARDGKLKPEGMQGGCFTISSLGSIGGSFFTPIINLPEVAIMGVSRAQTKPKWEGEKFIPRLMLPLSLSYDHRVIDGAGGARFMVYFSSLLEDIRQLLL